MSDPRRLSVPHPSPCPLPQGEGVRRRLPLVAICAIALAACDSGPLAKLEMPSLPSLHLPQVEVPEVQTPDLPRLDYVLDIYPQLKLPRLPLPDVERGVGGYTGPVAPIEQPVALTLNPPVHHVSFLYRTTGVRNDFQFAGDGVFETPGQELAFVADMWAFRDERSQRRSVTPPLAAARLIASRDGAVRGLVLDYPVAKRFAAETPARGSREDEAIGNGFRDLIQRLPEQPVKPGDLLPLPGPLARFLANRAAPPAVNSLQLEVVGLAEHRGRRALLARYGGEAVFVAEPDRVTYAVAGHALFDLETGLLVEGLLRVATSGSIDGKRVDNRVFIETAVTPP